MAEEQAFPYSDWLARIHPHFGVPWNMMLVIFAAEIVVGGLDPILSLSQSWIAKDNFVYRPHFPGQRSSILCYCQWIGSVLPIGVHSPDRRGMFEIHPNRIEGIVKC